MEAKVTSSTPIWSSMQTVWGPCDRLQNCLQITDKSLLAVLAKCAETFAWCLTGRKKISTSLPALSNVPVSMHLWMVDVSDNGRKSSNYLVTVILPFYNLLNSRRLPHAWQKRHVEWGNWGGEGGENDQADGSAFWTRPRKPPPPPTGASLGLTDTLDPFVSTISTTHCSCSEHLQRQYDCHRPKPVLSVSYPTIGFNLIHASLALSNTNTIHKNLISILFS